MITSHRHILVGRVHCHHCRVAETRQGHAEFRLATNAPHVRTGPPGPTCSWLAVWQVELLWFQSITVQPIVYICLTAIAPMSAFAGYTLTSYISIRTRVSSLPPEPEVKHPKYLRVNRSQRIVFNFNHTHEFTSRIHEHSKGMISIDQSLPIDLNRGGCKVDRWLSHFSEMSEVSCAIRCVPSTPSTHVSHAHWDSERNVLSGLERMEGVCFRQRRHTIDRARRNSGGLMLEKKLR